MSSTKNGKGDLSVYPALIVEIAKKPKHFGRMDGSSASAAIQGPCGEKMEFYLVIDKGVIRRAKFYTAGCISTVVCAETVAQLAQGKTLDEALSISPQQVKNLLQRLPESHAHCSILAVSTLFRAIADYLLKK